MASRRRSNLGSSNAHNNDALIADRFGLDDFDLGDTAEEKELKELERKLNEEVEEDLFEDPKRFNTLHRVIDVLGLQMMDDATNKKSPSLQQSPLEHNPAYRNLKAQQVIVEGAIEHMAVIHCADLNGSVIQVGRVARQFNDAVSKVRHLRKQVRDIQDTLGANDRTTPLHKRGPSNAASMSLRELWLKKLECEATLAILDRLDIIRAAPALFDHCVQQSPCRIGAAVLTLTRALATMFADDIAQIQALHKIMEQLLLRKQVAEEIVWDTMADVLYLRTGNALLLVQQKKYRQQHSSSAARSHTASGAVSSGHSVGSESRRSRTSLASRAHSWQPRLSVSTATGNIVNPFVGPSTWKFAMDAVVLDTTATKGQAEDKNNDDDSYDSNHSGASLFSVDDSDDGAEDQETKKSVVSETSSFVQQKRMMIPIPLVEAELDLEADERRCLEEVALSGLMPTSAGRSQRPLPRYADPILALRILVECLTQLGRVDDVERVLLDGLDREIRILVQREQARTFARLEQRMAADRSSARTLQRTGATDQMIQEFRRHLTGLLSAFGCVMVRLSHLAEVLRIRISSDRELMQKVGSPSSMLRSVLTAASEIMQREIKEFLKACLQENDVSVNQLMDPSVGEGSKVYENGLFSLAIADTGPRQHVTATATRSNVMEMTTAKFVSSVLFPKTKMTPQARYALSFRRCVARWTSEIDALNTELATLTNEDTSAPSFRSGVQSAISFLDHLIQNNLLPVLQEEAVNGTVKGLERRDAFDPVLGRGLYATANSNDPQDIDMCIACAAMHQSTGPLFMALHRLPRGGEMYMPLVAVLEHVLLTFTSRVKKQMDRLCEKKTVMALVKEEGKGPTSLAAIMERRRPCALLALAYADGNVLEMGDGPVKQRSGLTPILPSESDTASRLSAASSLKNVPELEEVGDGVDGEEQLLDLELLYVQKYFDFDVTGHTNKIVNCSDEELMKAACLSHSLLKLSSLLESRLKMRGSSGYNRSLTSTRTLREAIKSIRAHGFKLAKFCRLDILLQVASRMSKVAHSSTLVARDAVRIPSMVNDLGEYLTVTSDNLREASGNAITAYALSSLEQYIPFCLMQTVRVVAAGNGVVAKSPLTMNGIEALDRSGSVLYRDLKGATSFDNSSWDMELAAISFERSASFMAMMELEMEELVAYYTANSGEFSDDDFMLMFAMNGPRRRGDVGRFHMTKKNLSLSSS